MFLRAHQRKKDGKEHTYWSLVETIRTPDGPRQKVLCYLGELNGSARARWLKTIEVFNEQGESRQLKLFPSEVELPDNDSNVARVLINKVRLERTRQFGNCFVGLELWRRLKLDKLLEPLMDHSKAEVAWSRVAAVLAINRLCAPGSELSIEERWYPTTALDDLLRIPEDKINASRLYRCLDHLLPHKTRIERHLKERYGDLFGAEFDVLLYDLTSSYVEGAAEGNPLMKRGYSRDHRPDCKQLIIALVVNVEGFPINYEVFDGNRADVTTLGTILRIVEKKYGVARRIWVFDRGIVSEENLKLLRKHGGQYLVGTPRSKLKKFERELLQEDWEQIRPEVEVKLVSLPGDDETYVLCRTTVRKEKEKAIRSRFSQKMENALSRLEKRITEGKLKDRNKIERKLGAIQARHPQVADLYRMQVLETENGVRLEWEMLEQRKTWQQLREGAYLLRTNLKTENTAQLWEQYIQLTEAEAAFRALKSELSIRPIYHQLERRTKSHVLVAFLGYALWVTLKHLLRAKGANLSPAVALSKLATLQSADIVLPTTDRKEIRLRRITTPDSEQKELLHKLGMKLPAHLDFDRECSADSEIA
jgi:transposase